MNPANSLCEAMGGGKERVAPGCLSPGASLRVAKRPAEMAVPHRRACTSERQKLLEDNAAYLQSCKSGVDFSSMISKAESVHNSIARQRGP